jgi:hypothetical protein
MKYEGMWFKVWCEDGLRGEGINGCKGWEGVKVREETEGGPGVRKELRCGVGLEAEEGRTKMERHGKRVGKRVGKREGGREEGRVGQAGRQACLHGGKEQIYGIDETEEHQGDTRIGTIILKKQQKHIIQITRTRREHRSSS